MPDEYPWQESSISTGSEFEIEVSDEEYLDLINSINISEYTQATQESSNLRQQRMQRLWGQSYSNIVIDLIGAKNIELDKAGISVNSIELLGHLGVIKELLNTGGLKTARNLCLQLQPQFPAYSDVFNKLISDINTFLNEQNF